MRILRETAAAAAAAYLRGRVRKANRQEERKHRVTPTIPFQKLLDSFPEKIHKREEKHFLSDSKFYSAIASLVLEPEVAARRSQKGRKEAEEGARKEGEEVCRSDRGFLSSFFFPFPQVPWAFPLSMPKRKRRRHNVSKKEIFNRFFATSPAHFCVLAAQFLARKICSGGLAFLPLPSLQPNVEEAPCEETQKRRKKTIAH